MFPQRKGESFRRRHLSRSLAERFFFFFGDTVESDGSVPILNCADCVYEIICDNLAEFDWTFSAA